jgi:hypothetical protein
MYERSATLLTAELIRMETETSPTRIHVVLNWAIGD